MTYSKDDHVSLVLGEVGKDIRPVGVAREGPYVRDVRGDRWFDLSAGSHSCCLFYADREIKQDLAKAINDLAITINGRFFASPEQLSLAERIAGYLHQQSLSYFTSGGTEAMELAARIAIAIQSHRGRTKAWRIIGREFSYHGMSALARNIGTHPAHSPTLGALDYGWPNIGALGVSRSCTCREQLETVLDEVGEESVAAIVLEPIAGTTGGGRACDAACLARLVQHCRKRGVLVIADEVVTAFWRVGTPFASAYADPDMIVGGKCLAAGVAPVGCVVMLEHLSDEVIRKGTSLPLRLTFSGNPLATTAALVVQDYIIRNRLNDAVPVIGSIVRRLYDRAIASAAIPAWIEGAGALWALHVEIPTGSGVLLSGIMRKIAHDRKVTAMTGYDDSTFHLMFTPAFDSTETDLSTGVECSISLMEQFLASFAPAFHDR